jgi:hypothetical protein
MEQWGAVDSYNWGVEAQNGVWGGVYRSVVADFHHFDAVFRIHRIHMFLGLQDPDPLVRGMNPDPAPDYHHAKIFRKTLIPSILLLFLTFYLWKMMQMYLQKVP